MSLCTIIGVGPGIGLSVAKKFAREGFDIALVSRDEEKMKKYAREFTLKGTKARGFTADAGYFDSLRMKFSQIESWMGHTDVLVYNTAIVAKSSPTSITGEEFMAELQADIGGAFVAVQQILPSMERKGNGTLLFTGGGFAHDPSPRFTALSAGKAGLWNLCMNLAKEYEPKGIHVATVSVYGKVAPNTAYDPDKIAGEFWRLYSQPKEEWEREIHIR